MVLSEISCGATGDALTFISGVLHMCTNDKDHLENNQIFHTNFKIFSYITDNNEVYIILRSIKYYIWSDMYNNEIWSFPLPLTKNALAPF